MSLEHVATGPAEHPQAPTARGAGRGGPPDAARLQVLATEHWSLLATRSLTWSESFSRAGMFLSVLSGAVLALGLVGPATNFGEGFVAFALPLLSVVLFVGIATFVRLNGINNEDLRWVAGMNRLRHAYLEMYPDLERFFVTGATDDMRGISVTFGALPAAERATISLKSVGHGFVTIPGMLAVIVGVVAGALGAVIAVAVALPTGAALAMSAVVFFIAMVLLGRYMYGSIRGLVASLTPEFPSPDQVSRSNR